MSLNNFDGDGTAGQPSIIYAYDDGNKIRELCRSGYGKIGPSPGDVIERETTRSNPSERLPELELPGNRGLKEDDCGEEIPVFACNQCGKPKYLGRCCASPICKRDWPAAVKRKATRLAGKLDALRRKIYASYDGKKDVDLNHVIASLPGFLVDSESPMRRAYLVLKTLLEENWHIEGFAAVYHPYRIKKEYRKDQYEHNGEYGEGDMTWSDVLASDDLQKYVKYSPHFHLFFPAIRKSFDYMVAESVAKQSGWVFHRITQGEDSNISVHDLEDLVYQVTYTFSHAGVNEWSADRAELTSVMKGDLHNMWVSKKIQSECMSHFCQAAPKLLGTQFADLDDTTCDAELSRDTIDERDSLTRGTKTSEETVSEDLPVEDRQHDRTPTKSVAGIQHNEKSELEPVGGNHECGFSESSPTDSAVQDSDSQTPSDNMNSTNPPLVSSETTTDSNENFDDDTPPFIDQRSQCGGELILMREAAELLSDFEWCRKAPHVSGLRAAVREWSARTDGETHYAWVEEEPHRSPALIQLY